METLNFSTIYYCIHNSKMLSSNVLTRVKQTWVDNIEKVKLAWDVISIIIVCDGWTDVVEGSIIAVISIGGGVLMPLDVY